MERTRGVLKVNGRGGGELLISEELSVPGLLDALVAKANEFNVPIHDRRPLSERSKLSDRGLVNFRRVCDRMGILDRETDTIRSAPKIEKSI